MTVDVADRFRGVALSLPGTNEPAITGLTLASYFPRELELSLQENSPTIRIGVLAGEPIRLEGLTMVFEEKPQPGKPKLAPVVGTLAELVGNPDVDYLVVDLNSTAGGFELLDEVRRARPL